MQPTFIKLYERCYQQHALANGQETVRGCISGLVTAPFAVEEQKIQSFKDIHGYRVTLNGESAFFPRCLKEIDGQNGLARMRLAFLQVDLVLPPYYQMGLLSTSAAQIDLLTSAEEKEKFAHDLLTNMYSEDSIASLCLEVFKHKKAISPFYDYIVESVKAYYLGLYRAAIITLMPCIEGIIRNIGDQVDIPIRDEISKVSFLKVLTMVQKRDIRSGVYAGYDWVPDEAMDIGLFDGFHERVQMIESIKFFIEHSLYEHTSQYKKETRLNRHGIVHGIISDFHSQANYLRLLTMINALSVASIIAGDPGSLFHPDITPEAAALGEYLKKCKLFSFKTESK